MDNPGEILRLCRLCLVKDQVNIPIFEEQGDIRQIFLKISSCLPVKVSRDDKLPKKICDGCSNKLDLLYEFWNTSANAEKTLLSWLGQAGVKDADETISAVAQQIAKPAETQVKQEALEDGHATSQVQDNFGVQSFDEDAKDESEAPPPKRARRTAAVKAQINITPESDDDDDMDSAEAMTKVEDESDESDGEEKDPSYSEVPGTSADDQAGPSGVGKDGVEAPFSKYLEQELYSCQVCSQCFGSPEALKKHWKKLTIKTMCFCKTCGHFFGPNFQCDDPPERKKLNCFLCKMELQHTRLEDHICFHLGRKASPKKERLCKRVMRSKALKKGRKDKAVEQRKISELELYAQARSKYAKARKEYFEEVRKIKQSHYDKMETVKNSVEDENEDIYLEPEIVLSEESDQETDLCVFCSEEIPLQLLSKHESRHRIEEQILSLQQKRKPKIEPDKDELTICHICGQFVNRKNFRSHKQFHTRRKKAVICEICGFSSKNITQHRISHSDQRKYSCEKCDMSFKTSHALQKHDLVHTDVGQHRCPTCDKAFKAPYNLTVHMRSHMDKKPFECDFCDKTFTTKQWRDNHMKSHK